VATSGNGVKIVVVCGAVPKAALLMTAVSQFTTATTASSITAPVMVFG